MAPRTNQPVMSVDNINFLYGCRKVDTEGGCKNCYIARLPHKYIGIRQGLLDTFSGKTVPINELNTLKRLDRYPQNVTLFVNGLSDTFANDLRDFQTGELYPSDTDRDRWMGYFQARPWYQFMLCTKRTGQMAHYFSTRQVPPNVWVGTTI